MDDARQSLLKTIERLGREIVTCQNSMGCRTPLPWHVGRPSEWLHKLQTELFEAEAELAKLER